MIGIKEWSLEDRPREKFELRGGEALTKAELLAILVGTGNTEENAIDLMRRILADNDDNLRRLGDRTIEELTEYKGVGKAKAITILAACELGRRRMKDNVLRTQINGAKDIYHYFSSMHEMDHEECRVMFLNNSHKVLGEEVVAKGGINFTTVDIRLILRAALTTRMTVAIALCHNHPSGVLYPSREDDKLTSRVREACKAVDLMLLDHVIVSVGGYYSYAEEGKL